MSELATPTSEGSTPTPSAPVTAPASVFPADTSAPEWVKTAGLEDAHKTAKPPGAPVVPPVTPVVPTPPTVVPTVVPPPSTTPLDHVALAKAVADGIRTGNTPAPTGPTDAELAQQLSIVTVTPELYKGVFGVDGTPEQVKGLNDYGQAIAKQAVTIASVLFERQLKTLQDSLSPYTAVVRQQEASRIEKEFYTEHKDLTGYEEMVKQQYQLALQSGKTFASLAEASKFVADQTRSTLLSLGITPKTPIANGAPVSGKSVPQTRPMTPTSMGGKGGGNNQPTQPKSTVEQVWG